MVQRANDLMLLFTQPQKLEQAGINYALRSNRCRRCNRVLTVPASIHRGYGPECALKAQAYNF